MLERYFTCLQAATAKLRWSPGQEVVTVGNLNIQLWTKCLREAFDQAMENDTLPDVLIKEVNKELHASEQLEEWAKPCIDFIERKEQQSKFDASQCPKLSYLTFN